MSHNSPIVEALIDHIYGALLGDTGWQDFLDSLRSILPNGQAHLFYHDIKSGAGGIPLSAGVDPVYATSYEEYYSKRNPWMKGASTRPIGLGVPAKAMLPHEELLRSELYSDWLKPQGVDTAIGVTIAREQGCNFLLSVTYKDIGDQEAVASAQILQTLAPHLKRAFGFYRRSQGGGRALLNEASIFDNLQIGVVSLGLHGTVKSLNTTAHRLIDADQGIWIDRLGRLQCSQPEVMNAIGSELSIWAGSAPTSRLKTWLMSRPRCHLPLRITMFRPSRSASEVYFYGPEVLLLLESPEVSGKPAIGLIGRHYGLTRAEQRVMAGIADGRTLEDIAAAFKVSTGTVRAQTKSIFSKLGVQRQADIVRIVHLLGRGGLED